MNTNMNGSVRGLMFGIPCVVADNFLKIATGEQLKILIYVMRYTGETMTIEEISKGTGVSVEQAKDAVMFWQQVNVLASDNTIAFSEALQPEKNQPLKQENNVRNKESDMPTAVKKPSSSQHKVNYRPSEIADMMQNDSDFRDLCRTVECTLGNISNTMHNTLIHIHSYLGLKSEVIITLLNYCKEVGKANPNYIEKVAYDWAENEIDTLESALAKVESLVSADRYANQIARMFEMPASPTKKQRGFIQNWQNLSFSMELIQCAYERTIETINKLSFEYINTILMRWHNEGVKSIRDIESSDNNYKKGKKKSNKGDIIDENYDAEKYEILVNNV